MKNKSCLSGRLDVKAFTLIELLVVVLIIGILAAVALPQYQKAVEKSRGAQALTVLNSMSQAVQAYYMASGTYPTSFDELATNMDSWTGTEKWSNISGGSYGTLDTRSNGEWSLQLYKTQGGGVTLYIGRLTGKYKGAAFGRDIISSTGALYSAVTWCAERKDNGVIFTEPAGSYCQGIWKATWNNNDSNTFRAYKMP